MRVVVDTNALMMPVECNVRLFEELERLLGTVECLVPDAVVAELESLSGSASEEARAASVGRDDSTSYPRSRISRWCSA